MINAGFLTLLTLLTRLMDKKHVQTIEYLKEENRILRELIHDKYGAKRILLTDRQRKRLAAKAKPLGRKGLEETTDLFCPATILGWYRKLIARKFDGSENRKGSSPKVSQEKIDWVLKMAKENPFWGAGRISNYMKYLDMPIGKTTVWRIMEDHGFCPDPKIRKKNDWNGNGFIKSHFDVLTATDFFTVELLTRRGLVTCMVLFVIDISTRKVNIAGIKTDPDSKWTDQIARNLVDCEEGFLKDKTHLIRDRDSRFAGKFDKILGDSGVKVIKTPKQSPNLNAYFERFVQTIKHECLNHLILTNEKQLRYVVEQFIEYYHQERPHEGLGGKCIDPMPQDYGGEIIQFERLGGLLKSYRRVKQAA